MSLKTRWIKESLQTWGSSFKSRLRDPSSKGHGWNHGAADLKVGAPQGVSVAPRHGHHNSKRGGNKSTLRTQRLLDTFGDISRAAHGRSTPWPSYKQSPPPWTTFLNGLIPYITIHLTISLYSIDITLTYECETGSLAGMIPQELAKKAGKWKEKRISHIFHLQPAKFSIRASSQCSNSLSINHIYRKMRDTTRVDWGWVYMDCYTVHFSPPPGWNIQCLPLHIYVNMFVLHWEKCALRLPYKIRRPFPCWLPFMPPLAKRPTPLYQ